MRRNSDRLMIGFHWVTSLLVTAVFALGLIHAHTELMDDSPAWLDLHRTLGLLILAVTLARLVTRFSFGPIRNGSELTLPIRLASRVIHYLTYACLVAMPLLGWAQSSALTRHFKIFGMPFPALVGRNHELGDTLAWWHAQIGWLFLSLIALHAMAALFHHYVLRDDVLMTMIPGSAAKVRAEPPPQWSPELPEPKRRAA
jgi:cytochrome b561